MKAVLLAGGLGTRLRPLTEIIPKVMVEVGGKPLLWYHIQLLKLHGVKEVWICTHHMPEVIENFFGKGEDFGVNICYSLEKEMLGTAGALKNQNTEIERELRKDDFLVIYADNLTDTNYTRLIDLHYKNNSFFTMALYKSDRPWEKGVVETDTQDRVVAMIEKPARKEITTDQVNSGIYVCSKEVLDYIPRGISDFGFNIIPTLLESKKKVFAFNLGSTICDIGTPEGLKEAEGKVELIKSALNIA